MSLSTPEQLCPAVWLLIAFTRYPSVRGELAAWIGRIQSSTPGLALFFIVGKLDSVDLPGTCVQTRKPPAWENMGFGAISMGKNTNSGSQHGIKWAFQ
jgi:hypothetical protein